MYFQVVDGCRNTNYTDPTSLVTVSVDNDEVCYQSSFPKLASCPEAQCVFSKYGPSTITSWLQLLNLIGLFWLIFFLSAMGEMIMAGAFAGWYWTR